MKNNITINGEVAEMIANRINNTPISRAKLSEFCGYPDRTVRNAIHNLRNAGHHIISDPSKSGYWIGSDDEWNAFCDRERKAALSRLHRKTWESGRQLRIEVTS